MTLSPDVTLRTLTLGARDATTGWRAISFPESTVQVYHFAKGTTGGPQFAGTYAREDAMFITQDPLADGDQIKDAFSKYYEVVSVVPHTRLDSLEYYEAQAHELPMWQQPPSSTASWKTGPADPRSRTKDHIDDNARNASILKDDGITQASWACIFSNPPYPLRLEFRGASNMNGLYTVDQPNTTANMDPLTQSAYGYDESVPIHITTVDSTGCSGHQLQWRMEAELRYVYETFPYGSLRNPEKRSSTVHQLGSMQLYDTTFVINYRRGLTV